MRELPTEDVLEYSLVPCGGEDCVETIDIWIEKGDSCRWLACMNPHSYAQALRHDRFSAALHAADWLVPDGIGVVIASWILGGTIRERVTGSDIFHGVLKKLNRRGDHSVFFLGSTGETLADIQAQMSRDYPNVRVVGTYSPPFKDIFSEIEVAAMVSAINAAAPDVLWVGMTAPKQELWIHKNLQRLETVKFAAAIGAVFDFYTGRVKRSHVAFRRLGLEWFPRLVRDPRRLWRRVFVSAPIFLWHLTLARLAGARKR